MTPGHLALAANGLAHFLLIWSNALTTMWHRGHMPTGRSRLVTFNSALFDIKEARARKRIERPDISNIGLHY